MISNKEVKRTFKIFLDSNRSNSFSGGLFNANYYIDLTHIIFNDNDFNKSYYMYISFVSRPSIDIGATGLDLSNVYTLHIDMGKGLNIYQFNQVKNVSAIVPISYIPTAAPLAYFNLTDNLQKPVFIQDIRNISYITLNLINTTNNTTFSPNTPANFSYVCSLTFIEA